MTSRKRDSFGRFAASDGGSDLARFGQETNTYKKPRNMGIHSTMPGYPGAVGAMSSGQAPPDAGSLGASYSSGVIDLGSNSTSSVPLQSRPWSTAANIPPFAPGALLFVRRDGKLTSHGLSNQLRSVADLPTMNWLLRQSITKLNVETKGRSNSMDANSHRNYGSVLGNASKPNTGWSFIGTLRNEYQAPGSPVKLYNVDVFGRTKLANLFGRNVKSGDHLGLALVPVNLANFRAESGWAIYGPDSATTVTKEYVTMLHDDHTLHDMDESIACETATGKKFKNKKEYHVWQWLPTINGVICKEFWSLWPSDAEKEPVVFGSRRSGAPKVDFVDHVHLGCVSNCLMREKCVKRQMIKAPFETNTYTLCPQVELLLA